MKMTKEELAALLTGRQIDEEITKEECTLARESGLVVVFGTSDDLTEFRGAIYDEQDSYSGANLGLLPDGKMFPIDQGHVCNCDFCGFKSGVAYKRIEAFYDCDREWLWTFDTTIPHATFEVYDDEAKYCLGIVFAMEDLK